MNIQRAAPANEVLAKLLFLVLPTAAIGYQVIGGLLNYTGADFVQSVAAELAAFFGLGMVAATLFYALRFRFIFTFLALLVLLHFASRGIDSLPGEFDGFYYTIKFIGFSVLFTTGWVFGWGFLRLRYWSIFSAAVMLTGAIPVIAKLNNQTEESLGWSFIPVLLYAAYIIFAAEQIYNYKDKSKKFWWFLFSRIAGFAMLAGGLVAAIWWYNRDNIEATIAAFGSGGQSGQESMLKKDSSGSFNLKEYSRLQSRLAQSNELLFIAHIDNFFEGTDEPNPLYLTSFYYTKFDTATETFERDLTIPQNDLFEPDPGKIPLFSTRVDSSVIKKSGTKALGRVVEIEVYNKLLSPETYLAPHTGFFVQPITIEKEFRDSFKSAYRAKSYVSELNSAYFVYNAYKSKQISEFQQARFELLRKANDFSGEDPAFIKYYTAMPQGARWARIGELSRRLTAGANTQVDKVLKIRDYFYEPDSANRRPQRFVYTNNPGVPGIPDASKLEYFLFESQRGYCAYFAGATLFMLRSLGIPSRIAVGFLTEDRSDKNKGWYWYYANQAHAWVQVYFPGYGWLDFDTTVGDDGPHEAPATDGTPPLQPPRAWLAMEGVVRRVDTVQKRVQLGVKQFVFKDKEYRLDDSAEVTLDVHVAVMRRDSMEVPLASVKPGELGTAVSYADAFKNLALREGEGAGTLLRRFPSPEPIDEVYLRKVAGPRQQDPPPVASKEEKTDWKGVLKTAGIAAAGLVLLFFLLPVLIWTYLRTRAGIAKGPQQAYHSYRAASFYLHQLGFYRGAMTPMQYAREMVDPALGTSFASFMNSYLKLKYAGQPLTAAEAARVAAFLPAFLQSARSSVPLHRRALAFVNPFRTLTFYFKSEEDEA